MYIIITEVKVIKHKFIQYGLVGINIKARQLSRTNIISNISAHLFFLIHPSYRDQQTQMKSIHFRGSKSFLQPILQQCSAKPLGI